MTTRKVFALVSYLLLSIIPAFARQVQDLPEYVYRSWNNQNGLPQNTVYDLMEDSTGYMWGATEEGLFRFDGSRFEIFNETSTPGLISNTFYSIRHKDGKIWAAGRNAVLRIGTQLEYLYDFRKYTQGGWVRCLEVDEDGRVWVATSTGLLYTISGNSVTAFQPSGRMPFQSVEALRYTAAGLLIGTAKGLFLLPRGRQAFRTLVSCAGLAVTSISRASGSTVWISTASSGVRRVDVEKDIATELTGLQENFVNSVHLDPEDRLWIGFRSSGYQVLNNGQLQRPRQDQLSHDGVRAFCVGANDRIWMGTTSSGLFYVRKALISRLPDSLSMAGPVTLSIYQDGDGDTWVSSAGRGINRISGGKVQQLSTADGLQNNVVLSFTSRGPYVYIGSTGGLDRFNKITNRIDRHFGTANGLQNVGITFLFRDSKNRIWTATRMGGLHYMTEEEQIVPIRLPASANSATLLGILEDRAGTIWVGTRGTGVIKISRDGSIAHLTAETGFPASVVYSFLQDSEGDIWMSSENGLILARNEGYRVFNKESGLLFNEGYCLLQDDKENIWMSGNRGLQRFLWEDLRRVKNASSDTRRMAVRVFNEFDGMPHSETNGGFFPAGWRLRNGTLWFPTVGGVAVADNNRIDAEQEPLAMMVQSLRYADQLFFPGSQAKLPAGVNNFEIRYTSIQFSKAGDLQFRYRLNGFDNGWTNAGNRQVAYFTSLPPGEYSFEVQAELYGESSPISTFQFRIAPYFYQTLGFRVLLVALILVATIGVIYLVRRKELRRLRQQQLITRAQMEGQERERQLISAELHDSINQQLATAKIYLDYARVHPADREELIGRSADVIHRAIQEIRSLCYSLTPVGLRDMGLREAVDDLCKSYSSVGQFKTNIQYSIDGTQLPDDLQFVLFRVIQEQMNNIARHAYASEVWIELKEDDRNYYVYIRDNGKGFDPAGIKEGLGFANMRNRLSVYNGRLELDTAPGIGCTLQVQVPRK